MKSATAQEINFNGASSKQVPITIPVTENKKIKENQSTRPFFAFIAQKIYYPKNLHYVLQNGINTAYMFRIYKLQDKNILPLLSRKGNLYKLFCRPYLFPCIRFMSLWSDHFMYFRMKIKPIGFTVIASYVHIIQTIFFSRFLVFLKWINKYVIGRCKS